MRIGVIRIEMGATAGLDERSEAAYHSHAEFPSERGHLEAHARSIALCSVAFDLTTISDAVYWSIVIFNFNRTIQ